MKSRICAWNGSAWLPVPSNDTLESWTYASYLRGIWGSGPNDVWVVGDAGAILQWDGNSLAIVPSGITNSLRAIWGSATNDLWAVGDNGTILHRRP
jgi:hypothetical protein